MVLAQKQTNRSTEQNGVPDKPKHANIYMYKIYKLLIHDRGSFLSGERTGFSKCDTRTPGYPNG